MLGALFNWLQESPPAIAISEGGWLFPMIESIHVLALALVVGSIAIMDFRLLGVFGRSHRVTRIAKDVLPWTWTGFVVAAISGSTLFISAAARYAENPFFRTKFVLLALAGLNMAIFHFITWHSVDAWDENAPTPRAAKAAGLLSLAFWVGVVICGRWVGFT